jgi:hypothetical protein
MRFKSVSIILLSLLFAIVTVSCIPDETEWKGIIEEKDGVIIVRNPKEPMYQQNIFQ